MARILSGRRRPGGGGGGDETLKLLAVVCSPGSPDLLMIRWLRHVGLGIQTAQRRSIATGNVGTVQCSPRDGVVWSLTTRTDEEGGGNACITAV